MHVPNIYLLFMICFYLFQLYENFIADFEHRYVVSLYMGYQTMVVCIEKVSEEKKKLGVALLVVL